MNQLTKIANELGRANICEALGIQKTALSNAEKRLKDSGILPPSSWYLVLRGVGEKQGVDVPESLFNFKTPKEKSEVA